MASVWPQPRSTRWIVAIVTPWGRRQITAPPDVTDRDTAKQLGVRLELYLRQAEQGDALVVDELLKFRIIDEPRANLLKRKGMMPAQGQEEVGALSLRALARQFCEQPQFSQTTQQSYPSILEPFLVLARQATPAEAFSREALARFAIERITYKRPMTPAREGRPAQRRGRPPVTGATARNNERKVLSSWATWLRARGLIESNVVYELLPLMPTMKDERVILEPDEVRALLTTAAKINPPLGLWVRLSIETGIRLGELEWLQWRDIDADAEMLLVREKSGFHPKTYERRTIPLRTDTVAALVKLRGARGPADWVVADARGRRLSAVPRKQVVRLWQAAGVPWRTWHILRHTAALRFLEAGITLPRIQRLLGHADLETTLKYLKLFDSLRGRDEVRMLLPSAMDGAPKPARAAAPKPHRPTSAKSGRKRR